MATFVYWRRRWFLVLILETEARLSRPFLTERGSILNLLEPMIGDGCDSLADSNGFILAEPG